ITDVQLKTAFLSEAAMMAFIDGIFMTMYNTLEVAYENLGHMARASLIGGVLYGARTTCVVNLLAEYNALVTTPLTLMDAMRNLEFLKFASARIKMVSDYMVKMSTTFNTDAWERFTPKDKQVFEVLSYFASMLDTYMQADVYHNELTKLQYYKNVPYWQASGTTWDFSSVSSINIQVEVPAANNTTTLQTVNQSGIVAVIRDIDSVGITIDNRRTKSIYNPHDELTNYWEKAELGYFRDNSENCVVFIMEETENTRANSLVFRQRN
ncbi:MAG: hypothetical protein K2O54_05570, partial [Prevotella sp.]|nr:hypothetical protein [Prevotella sp.]